MFRRFKVMAALPKKSKVLTKRPAGDGSRAPVQPLVLVVEDHADTRFLVKRLLEMHGYRVIEAGDGEQAVRLAETMHPDLVLMDTNLPRVDGLTATRRMRGLANIRKVPIVFLSGHAQPKFRAMALAMGGDDYVTKPFDPMDLQRIVERHLHRANGGG